MNEQDWKNIAHAIQIASNYSTTLGQSIQKLIFEYGKLLGKDDLK